MIKLLKVFDVQVSITGRFWMVMLYHWDRTNRRGVISEYR